MYPGNGGAHAEQMDTHYNGRSHDEYSDNEEEDEDSDESKVAF